MVKSQAAQRNNCFFRVAETLCADVCDPPRDSHTHETCKIWHPCIKEVKKLDDQAERQEASFHLSSKEKPSPDSANAEGGLVNYKTGK